MTEPARHAPDLEDLAAYVDGRLSPERRAWVEEHLVRDEELYEVFQATVEFQQEHGRGVARPRPGRTWLLIPLAAAAVLVLTLAPGLLRDRAPSERWAARLEPAAIANLTAQWSDPGWSRNRSADACPAAENLPFRMGAWSLDLRLALLAGDDDEALLLAARMGFLARCGDLLPVERAYERLQGTWESTRPVDRRELAAATERDLAEVFADAPLESRLFRLGGWAEAGRLAAVTRDPQALVRIVRSRPEVGEIPEIAAPLARLETIAKRSTLEERDLTAAGEAFAEILKLLAL